MPNPNPYIKDGIERLRTKWPQSHYQASEFGANLVIVPSVLLPRGYKQTICTVLFIAPPGFPAACPDHFFTDIPLELRRTRRHFSDDPEFTYRGNFPDDIWPAWKGAMWWSWQVQHWNPNSDSLYSYMKVIQKRLELAR